MEPGLQFAVLLEIGEGQRGVVTRAQIDGAGISPRVLTRLVREGWLRRIRRGAYALPGRKPSTWEDAVAVGLLAGPGSGLSHQTAAAIHGFHGVLAPRSPHVILPPGNHRRFPGATVHRTLRLDPCDLTPRYGVGVTTRERTLVDLSASLDLDLLARIVDEGCIAQWWTAKSLLDSASRIAPRGRPGLRDLNEVLGPRLLEPRADSHLELRMIRILAPFAPFETHFQLVLDGRLIILDIAWPQFMVAAECDGFSVHGRSRDKFDRDQERNNLLSANGWKVAHLTSTMNDDAVLTSVGRLLPAAGYIRR